MAKPSVDQVKKFDTVTDKATKALTTATANLTKVMGDLTAQVEIVEILSEEIQVKQEQRDNLDKELGIKVREHEAELALQIRENEEKVLYALLDKTGRADLKANISSLESQVAYLTQQVNTYKEMLDNERVTREKVADASARAAEANRPVAPRN